MRGAGCGATQTNHHQKRSVVKIVRRLDLKLFFRFYTWRHGPWIQLFTVIIFPLRGGLLQLALLWQRSVFCNCAGIASDLVLMWHCSDIFTLALVWYCSGIVLALVWHCSGIALVLFWQCSGIVHCSGIVLVLFWNSSCIVLALFWPMLWTCSVITLALLW